MDKTKKRFFHGAIAIGLIALGVLGMFRLKACKSELQKSEVAVPLPVVRTMEVKIGKQTVVVRAEGTVRPFREINLVPQVDGKVVYLSPSLVNGGEFIKGDNLLCIEPVDYELAVTLARAKVKNSESKLQLIQEEAAAAREEWCQLYAGGSQAKKEPPPLVAKEPQLAAAEAGLAADRANLRKALLSLERTRLFAPFNGRVSQENVDTGEYVSPGQSLATLYSTDIVEVVLPLEDEELFWLHVPGFTPGNHTGSFATVYSRVAGRDLSWPGEVVRAEGKLDERTRMVNLVILVKSPYTTNPPLAVGLFVTVDIKGLILPNAAIIPRAALRQGNLVWVVGKDGKLHFRKVEVARIQGEEVLVKSGIKDGETLVMSSLKAVSNGMLVRTIQPKE